MLKKLILAVAVFIFMAVPAMAADLITTPYSLGNLSGLNLQGDILYLPSSGTFAAGAGTNLATIYDMIEIRGEAVEPVDGSGARAGLGIGVNLPKLVGKLRGSWLMDNINSSIGVTGLLNLDGEVKIEPAVYLTVIQMGF